MLTQTSDSEQASKIKARYAVNLMKLHLVVNVSRGVLVLSEGRELK